MKAAGLDLLAGRVLGPAVHEPRFEPLNRHEGQEALKASVLEPATEVWQCFRELMVKNGKSHWQCYNLESH